MACALYLHQLGALHQDDDAQGWTVDKRVVDGGME